MQDDNYGIRACQSRRLAMLHAPRNTRRHTVAKNLIVAGIVLIVAAVGVELFHLITELNLN